MVRYSSPHRAGVAQSGADRVGRSCSLLAGFDTFIDADSFFSISAKFLLYASICDFLASRLCRRSRAHPMTLIQPLSPLPMLQPLSSLLITFLSPIKNGVEPYAEAGLRKSAQPLSSTFADSLRLVLRPTAKRWGVDSGFDCFAACIAFGLFGSRC